MAAEDNKNLARTVYEAFNNGDLDQVLTYATEDVEVVFTPSGQTFHGHEGFRTFMQTFRTAFPDIQLTVTHQLASDDGVVNEFTWQGTHTGPLASPGGDIPATGRRAGYPVCEVWEIRGGKLAVLRNYQDAATLLQQLGVIPAPEGAEA
jgi:steroid delta-isomerase-like uncharacterized protein